MPSAAAKRTRVQEVYDHIRTSLLSGRLTPGSRMNMNLFTAEHGVSLSVVREAVTRLAGEGLVDASPQRGFTVRRLTVEDLQDLTRARVLIETLALAESIEHGDLAWEASVLATHHALANTPLKAPSGEVEPAYTLAHRTFHHSLLAGCGSSHLEGVANGLRDCAELYQHWAYQLAPDNARDIAAEHRAIAELTVARDAAGATRALREHIERTSAALVRYAEETDGLDQEQAPA